MTSYRGTASPCTPSNSSWSTRPPCARAVAAKMRAPRSSAYSSRLPPVHVEVGETVERGRVVRCPRHTYRVPGQPATPHVVAQRPGLEVERQVELARAVRHGRVASGVPQHLERLEDGIPRAKIARGLGEHSPEERLRPPGPSEHAERGRELGGVTVLEIGVAGVRPRGAKDVGVAEGEHERTVPAARGTEDRAGSGPIPVLDPRDDLLENVVLVPSGRRGVEVLAPAQGRQAIGSDQDRFGGSTRVNERVQATNDGAPEEERPVEVHPSGTGVPREEDEQRQPLGAPRRGKVDRDVPHGRVVPWVPFEDPALEPVDLDRAGQGSGEDVLAPRVAGDRNRHRRRTRQKLITVRCLRRFGR
jgi:hypothetical protein